MGWYGDNPRERGEHALEKRKSIEVRAKSEGRPRTGTEQTEYDELFKEAEHCVAMLKKQRADKEFMAALPDLGSIGGGAGLGGSLQGRRADLQRHGRYGRQRHPAGTKALAPSGAAVVGQEFTSDPVALGKPALSLLDILPVIPHATPELSYLRQTARTNNAAEVSAGAVKPTSVYSVTKIENSLEVVAHLSEGIARHWLLDNTSLDHLSGVGAASTGCGSSSKPR